MPLADIETSVPALLDTIQAAMFEKARDSYMSRLKVITQWSELVPTLDAKCVAVLPWCEEEKCEDGIKDRSAQESQREGEKQDERAPSAGAKSLCIPFDQARYPPIEPGKTKCPACGKDAKRWTMFGRSY